MLIASILLSMIAFSTVVFLAGAFRVPPILVAIALAPFGLTALFILAVGQ